MVKRQKQQHSVLLSDASTGDELDIIGHQVLLRQHHAFGETRRATGVWQGHEVLGPVQWRMRWMFGGRLTEQVAEEIRPRFGPLTYDNNLFQAPQLWPDGTHQRIECFLDNQYGGSGIVELVLNISL